MKFSIILFCSFVLISCARNVEEDLIITNPASPETVTYSKNIAPLLSTHCVSCHSGLAPSAGVGLKTYEEVVSWIVANEPENSDLYNIINHTKEPVMPKGQAKLPEKDIKMLETWILNGAKND